MGETWASGALAGIKLFADLPAKEREEIERACRWRRHVPHEQIIDRQSDSRDVCFVVEGGVRVVNYSLSGREITLDDLGPGDHFGELAALDGQPRSASVMALTQCLIASLPPARFIALLERHPGIALKVMRHMAQIVRVSTDRIMDLSTIGANNRVHAELLRHARTAMDGANRAVIRPIPVHGDLAGRVSTTRETVARVMNDLARQGIVERTRDALVVLDVARLQELVDETRGA